MLRKRATKFTKQQVTKSVYNYCNIFIIIAICLKLNLLDEIQSNVLKTYCYFIGFVILAVRFIIVIMRMLKYNEAEVNAINQWSATTDLRNNAGPWRICNRPVYFPASIL